jgi:hypothetical protein
MQHFAFRIGIRFVLPILVMAATAHNAFAQAAMCGDAPAMTDLRLKGELDSKATVLSRFLGDLKFKGQVEVEKQDVLSRYPNADKLRLNQYFLYQVCILIMSDSRMSTEKKYELLTHARESIFNPSAERSNWLSPESFRLTVNGFHIDKSAEYEGILNFTIDNRSGNDLGIGILTNAGTGAGCSGSMVLTGLPAVAPPREVLSVSGTIPWGALVRASDPARLLRWFPAGGRLSATIQWHSCSAGIRSRAVAVPVVLAKGRDVFELSLSSDQR